MIIVSSWLILQSVNIIYDLIRNIYEFGWEEEFEMYLDEL